MNILKPRSNEQSSTAVIALICFHKKVDFFLLLFVVAEQPFVGNDANSNKLYWPIFVTTNINYTIIKVSPVLFRNKFYFVFALHVFWSIEVEISCLLKFIYGRSIIIRAYKILWRAIKKFTILFTSFEWNYEIKRIDEWNEKFFVT